MARNAFDAAAAWLVGSQSRRRRYLGFRLFLLSNLLWVVWGWHARAYALILLQACLAALNIRGAQKNDPEPIPATDRCSSPSQLFDIASLRRSSQSALSSPGFSPELLLQESVKAGQSSTEFH
jgi:hypothetical protein